MAKVLAIEQFWQDCQQEYQCWRMYGYLVEELQDSMYVEDTNTIQRKRHARTFRKGQVFHLLYSSYVDWPTAELAREYVNDHSQGYTSWWDYYDYLTSTKH